MKRPDVGYAYAPSCSCWYSGNLYSGSRSSPHGGRTPGPTGYVSCNCWSPDPVVQADGTNIWACCSWPVRGRRDVVRTVRIIVTSAPRFPAQQLAHVRATGGSRLWWEHGAVPPLFCCSALPAHGARPSKNVMPQRISGRVGGHSRAEDRSMTQPDRPRAAPTRRRPRQAGCTRFWRVRQRRSADRGGTERADAATRGVRPHAVHRARHDA